MRNRCHDVVVLAAILVAPLPFLAACGQEPRTLTADASAAAADKSASASSAGSAASRAQLMRDVAQVAEDAIISSKVKAELESSVGQKSGDIDVSTTNRGVTLKGMVDDPAIPDRAVQVARAVDGVARVESELMVRPTQ
jgi:osmotically-inducible protein OsmY